MIFITLFMPIFFRICRQGGGWDTFEYQVFKRTRLVTVFDQLHYRYEVEKFVKIEKK